MLGREDYYMKKQMRKQSTYIIFIAAQVGCSERTVRRYLKYPEPPARKTRHKMANQKPFMDYIDTWGLTPQPSINSVLTARPVKRPPD